MAFSETVHIIKNKTGKLFTKQGWRNRGGCASAPHYYLPPQIFRPSAIPAKAAQTQFSNCHNGCLIKAWQFSDGGLKTFCRLLCNKRKNPPTLPAYVCIWLDFLPIKVNNFQIFFFFWSFLFTCHFIEKNERKFYMTVRLCRKICQMFR